VRDYAIAGCDPSRMGLGPVFAMRKLFKKTGMSLRDFDLFEINEAFAAQVLACLKALVASAMFLAGSLGESWFDVLEALQNADYVLTSKGSKAPLSTPSKRTSVLGTPQRPGSSQGSVPSSATPAQMTTRHPVLTDLDADSVQMAIQRLFDASKNLDDTAFKDFVNALCKLSSEMVGMQALAESSVLSSDIGSTEDVSQTNSTTSLSTNLDSRREHASRRRVSGIHLPRTLVGPVLFFFSYA